VCTSITALTATCGSRRRSTTESAESRRPASLSSIPATGGFPYDATAGGDGHGWFTEVLSNQIGRLAPP
jgi:hypothetical protein